MNAIHNEYKAIQTSRYQHIHHDDGDPAIRYMPEPIQRGHLRYVDLDGRWQRTGCEKHQAQMSNMRDRYLSMRQRGLGHNAAKALAITGDA